MTQAATTTVTETLPHSLDQAPTQMEVGTETPPCGLDQNSTLSQPKTVMTAHQCLSQLHWSDCINFKVAVHTVNVPWVIQIQGHYTQQGGNWTSLQVYTLFGELQ